MIHRYRSESEQVPGGGRSFLPPRPWIHEHHSITIIGGKGEDLIFEKVGNRERRSSQSAYPEEKKKSEVRIEERERDLLCTSKGNGSGTLGRYIPRSPAVSRMMLGKMVLVPRVTENKRMTKTGAPPKPLLAMVMARRWT